MATQFAHANALNPMDAISAYRDYAKSAVPTCNTPAEADAVARQMTEMEMAYGKRLTWSYFYRIVEDEIFKSSIGMQKAMLETGSLRMQTFTLSWSADYLMDGGVSQQAGTTTVQIKFPDTSEYESETIETVKGLIENEYNLTILDVHYESGYNPFCTSGIPPKTFHFEIPVCWVGEVATETATAVAA